MSATSSPETLWVLPEGAGSGAEGLGLATSPQYPVPSLQSGLGLPALACALLARRGVTEPEAIRRFLQPSLADLLDPALLPDITLAAERIARAVSNHERILVFGDYDVDGLTGTALLVRALTRLGGDVISYVPSRVREGYGLSEPGVRHAKEKGCALIVTTDCGITDFPEVDLARQLGLDIVVTDHHEPKDHLPRANAVVNPKRLDSAYPFTELCGCGVAFKLAQVTCRKLSQPEGLVHEHLDLVALATVADMVPLTGENRVLARIGLAALARTQKPGLRALLGVCGLIGKPLGSYDVGFLLGPRINASGRMTHADASLRLLLTEDKAEALQLSRELDAANKERRAVEDSVVEEAVRKVEAGGLQQRRVLVLADEGWHEGVVGIVASRIVDRFYRPTIMIALDGDRGKGSGRSIPGFHLHDALKSCEEVLAGFGGHKYAAGLSIERSRIAEFDRRINEYAEQVLTPDLLQRRVHVDALASLKELTPEFFSALRQFEPFGTDNPRPVLAALGLEVVGFPRRVGDDHLSFTVREDKSAFLPAIAFRRAAELLRLQPGKEGHIDLAFVLDERTYAGRTKLQLTVKDMRIH